LADESDLVLLEDQDRGRWDPRLIGLGLHHFDRSMAGDGVSEYHVQAAIAAAHARASVSASLDWPLILHLHDQLLAINPSPVVALNRAVAVAKVHGPAQALEAIAPLENDPKLRDYYLWLTVRGSSAAGSRAADGGCSLFPHCPGLSVFGAGTAILEAKTGRLRTADSGVNGAVVWPGWYRGGEKTTIRSGAIGCTIGHKWQPQHPHDLTRRPWANWPA
jgi:hypothetical protein